MADLLQLEAQIEGALVGVVLDSDATARSFPAAQTAVVLPPLVNRLLQAWAAVPPAECSQVRGGRDLDGDGAPVGFRAVFNCLDLPLLHGGRQALVSIVGTVTLEDLDDTIAGGGLRLTAIGLGLRVRNADGTAVTRTLDGTFTARATDGGKGIELDRSIRLGLRTAGIDGDATQVELDSAGLLTLGGSVEEPTGSYSGDATLLREGRWIPLHRRTDEALRWRRECYRKGPAFSGFVAGAYRLEDVHGQVLRVELGGCGPVVAAGFVDCRVDADCAP